MCDRRELEAWLADGLRNPDGSPMIFFHGTNAEAFNIFAVCEEASLGFHFGTLAAATDRLRQIAPEDTPGRVVSVYCRARNPLWMNDHFTWGTHGFLSDLLERGVIFEDEAEFVDELVEEHPCEEILYALLENKGYDSVLYVNETEARDERQASLMIWRAALVKGTASSAFTLGDPRILEQHPAGRSETQMYQLRESEIDEWKARLAAGPAYSVALLP